MASLRDILRQAGFRGAALDTAYAVAMAESGGRATAHNGDSSTGDNSYGLFQINMLGQMGPDRRAQYGLSSNEDLFDPLTNAKIAYRMSNGGKNWGPWSAYNNGSYRQYLGGGDTQVAAGKVSGDAGSQKKGGGSDYGSYGYVDAFLEKHPQIKALLDKADDESWLPERLAGEIKDTNWWRNHTEAERKWSLIIAESPAQADKLTDDMADAIKQAAGRAGVRIGDKELKDLARKGAAKGWDDTEIAMAIARRFDLQGKNSGQTLIGTAGQAADEIDRLSWEYGVKMDRHTRERWIRRTLAGNLDPTTLEDKFREQAKIMYAPVANRLDNSTMRDLLSPYMQVAADQLGIDPAQMNTGATKWTVALTGGQNGKPMTADEWAKTIRTDQRYGWDKTSTARTEAAQLTGQLAKMMGVGF